MTIAYDKTELMNKFKRHPSDTASAEVQIAMLNNRLQYLNEHFNKNPKDHASRRGLLKIVGKRRQLMTYLHRKDPAAYHKVISELGIRVKKT